MFLVSLRAVALLLVAALAYDPMIVHACTATAQDVFTVGNKSTDSSCNYDTIQDAITAATCAAGTKIMITPERSYLNQHLVIADRNVSLIGRGAGKCNSLQVACGITIPCPTQPLITLYGDSGGSLIQVTGTSNVVVKYLTLFGATASVNGGGIDFEGTGTLTIDTSTIEVNTAVSGGGIYFKGVGTSNLVINSNTQIIANTATYLPACDGGGFETNCGGGGIHIEGAATLTMTAPQIVVESNFADNSYGGGIQIIGPASANIGSPGFNGTAVIYANEALYGGGIAMRGGDITLSGTSLPAGIEQNSATYNGGGLYLAGPSLSFSASNYHIDHNGAREGSAIYSEPGASGALTLGNSACSDDECNTVSYNHNSKTNNVPDGSIIKTASGIYLDFSVDGLHMRFNDGSHLMDLSGPSSVQDTLFVDNQASGQLLYNSYGTGAQGATWTRCTVAHNLIGNSQVGPWPVFAFNGYLKIFDSIISQPDHPAVASAGGGLNFSASTILANDVDGLTSGTPIQADPAFVDAENGDFHLLARRVNGVAQYSPAIDAVYGIASGFDVDHRPRAQDIDGIGGSTSDHFVQDLGAYEMQPFADRLFIDGFGDPVLLAF